MDGALREVLMGGLGVVECAGVDFGGHGCWGSMGNGWRGLCISVCHCVRDGKRKWESWDEDEDDDDLMGVCFYMDLYLWKGKVK